MRNFPRRWQLGRLLVVMAFLAVRSGAFAHGETLLRIADLTRQLEGNPTNRVQIYLLRGDLFREHQDWKSAEADYASAAKLQPNLPAVRLGQANLLVDTGRLDAAEALFTEITQEFPREGEAFIGRGRVLIRLNRRKEAIEDLQRGVKLVAIPQPECFLELAQALIAEEQPGAALQTLNEGIKRLGPLVSLQEVALQIELRQKNLEGALQRIDSILKVATREESWLAQKGDILLLAQRPEEAHRSFMLALKAVDALPRRLQQSPAVIELVAHIRSALQQATSTPKSASD